MKLIDKDALVAEIHRRLEALASASAGYNREFAAIIGAQQYELINLAQYINTLEVKEVNLEEENIIGILEREVKIDAGGYPYLDCDGIEFYDYDKDIPLAKEGDKVKVIVIKKK